MKVMTLNINGIRAGARKGFFEWFAKQSVDVLCLQEIKAQENDLGGAVFFPEGYRRYLAPAVKKGYSGVALYCKQDPLHVSTWDDWAICHEEGRAIVCEFEGVIVASLYLPSGSSGDVRQSIKFEYLDALQEKMEQLKDRGKPVILAGDWNIAHTKKDLKNWRGNLKNSGFLPEERAWMDCLFQSGDWVDAFRLLNQEEEQYTWWSNRGRARENNVGWRIDYQVITSDLAQHVRAVSIETDENFSDHAPFAIEYDSF